MADVRQDIFSPIFSSDIDFNWQAFRLSDQVFPSNIYAPAMARPTSSEPWPSEPPLQLMQRPSSPPMCRGQVPKNLRKDVKKIEKV
jgi:hypothetical protein